jgi:SAM-dependent methyltransferase
MSYYNQNATRFFTETIDVDMSPLYSQFLPLLPDKARVLDAGCGSGRDAGYFSQYGLLVDAFDASEELVNLAREHTSLDVQVCQFLHYQSPFKYDGIWACASLLHVPKKSLPQTFQHLAELLKPDGIFYCSFKYGEQEIERNGRQFTNLTKDALSKVLIGSGLCMHSSWKTEDVRPGRVDEYWLNAILVKEKL